MDQDKVRRWKKLCADIIIHARTCPKNSSMQYARTYASTGLTMVNEMEISSQAFYVSNNIRYLNGPKGQDFKERIKEFF